MEILKTDISSHSLSLPRYTWKVTQGSKPRSQIIFYHRVINVTKVQQTVTFELKNDIPSLFVFGKLFDIFGRCPVLLMN